MVSKSYVKENNISNITCNTCKETKSLDFFSIHDKYYRNTCKSCCSKQVMKNYNYIKNPVLTKICLNCKTIFETSFKDKIYCKKSCNYKFNSDKIKKQIHSHYTRNKDNPDFIKRKRIIANRWTKNNKDKIRISARKSHKRHGYKYRDRLKEKVKNDPILRMNLSLRGSLRSFFRKANTIKPSKFSEILGCDWNSFVAYLESKFTPGMTMKNHGGKRYNSNGSRRKCWEIDHIIPMHTAKTKEDIVRLNHYSNLQPLWWWDNVSRTTKPRKE